MATSLRPEHAAPSLFSLSGELRNQIYSYCTGSIPTLDISGTAYDSLRLVRHYSTSPPRVFFKRRPFFGLTQTNRLLREEFRPLHMRTHQVHIQITQLTPFLEAFFPKVSAPSKELSEANYYGNIVISGTYSKIVTADITHVINLRAYAPEIVFQVKPSGYNTYALERQQLTLLNLLISDELCSLVRFQRWSYDTIARVEVKNLRETGLPANQTVGGQIFTVTFKKHASRPWMDGKLQNPASLALNIKKQHRKGDGVDGPFINVLFGAHARSKSHEWHVRAVVEE